MCYTHLHTHAQRSCSLIIVINDLIFLVDVPVVEDTEDVLARAVDGTSKEEVGEAEIEVLLVKFVVTILRYKKIPVMSEEMSEIISSK